MRLNNETWTSLISSIHNALEKAATTVIQHSPGGWNFRIGGPKGSPGTVRLDREFLLFDVMLSEKREHRIINEEDLWQYLCWNSRTLGRVKFAMGAKPQSVRMRAEIPLAEDKEALRRRICNVCFGFRNALEMSEAKDSYENRSTNELQPRKDLIALCEETGWSFSQRDKGMVVRLDVPGRVYNANIFERKDQGVVASVELVAGNNWPRQSKTALGLMLLIAGGHVRMVRPSAGQTDEGRRAVYFEVIIEDPLCSADFDHELSALSVACDRWGKEVRVFRNEEIASNYLKVQGWSS